GPAVESPSIVSPYNAGNGVRNDPHLAGRHARHAACKFAPGPLYTAPQQIPPAEWDLHCAVGPAPQTGLVSASRWSGSASGTDSAVRSRTLMLDSWPNDGWNKFTLQRSL